MRESRMLKKEKMCITMKEREMKGAFIWENW